MIPATETTLCPTDSLVPVVDETIHPVITVTPQTTLTAVTPQTTLTAVTPQSFNNVNPATVINISRGSFNKNKVICYPTQKVKLKFSASTDVVSNSAITWKSANTKIATVNQKGVITAKKKGKTTVCILDENGTILASCNVVVKKATIKITKKSIAVKQNSVLSIKKFVKLVKADKIKKIKIGNTSVLKKMNTKKVKVCKKGKTKITIVTKFGAKKSFVLHIK